MATFKNLWNYPNNSANGYATDSANWSGDETFGIDKRVKDLRLNNYKLSLGLSPGALNTSTEALNLQLAKYAYGLEKEGPDENLTMYNMWWNPLVEATAYGSHNLTPNKIETNGDDVGRSTYKVHFTTDHGLEGALYPNSSGGVGNFEVDFRDTNQTNLPSAVSPNFNDLNEIKTARIISGDTDSIWVGNNTVYANIPEINMAGNQGVTDVVYISTGTGVKSYAIQSAHNSEVADTSKIRFFNGSTNVVFTDATNDTGTITAVNTDRYITKGTQTGISSNDLTTIEYFTNVGKTTKAELNEEYYGTFKMRITNSSGSTQMFDLDQLQASDRTYTLSSMSVVESTLAGTGSNTGVDTNAELRQKVASERGVTADGVAQSGPYNGIQSFCRLQFANISGSTPVANTGGPITTSIDEAELRFLQFYYNDNFTDISTLWKGDRTTTGRVNISVPDGTAFDMLIHVIDPGRLQDATVAPHHLEYTSGLGTMARKTAFDKYYASTFAVHLGGSATYKYQNSSNVTTNGAEGDTSIYWIHGTASPYYADNTTGQTLTQTNSMNPAVTLDSNGRFSSIAAGTRGRGGIFDANTQNFMLSFKAKADEYVNPTYAPDIWDTDDEWDTDAFNIDKRWPIHIAPASAKLLTNQPTTKTISQSGQKFIRSSGVIRTEIEFEYPPLTYDEFRQFQAIAEAAQGQKNPFYLQFTDLGPDSNLDVLFQRKDADADGGLVSPFDFRVRDAISVGNKTVLVEGFPSSQNNCLAKGETIIADIDYRNGDFVTVVNDVTSNIFGEAKFRIPYPANKAVLVGTQFYKNPNHAIVTLGEDGFEYTVTTDGYYYLQCKFQLDEFK